MSVHTYHKECKTPHKEVEKLIAELEAAFRRSARYSYHFESAHFTNISFTKPYLRLMKRLCANISFVVEQKQVRAWVHIIKSEMVAEFGPLYESAYTDFRREIEGYFDRCGYIGIDGN